MFGGGAKPIGGGAAAPPPAPMVATALVRSLHRLLSYSPLRPRQRQLLRVPLQLRVSLLLELLYAKHATNRSWNCVYFYLVSAKNCLSGATILELISSAQQQPSSTILTRRKQNLAAQMQIIEALNATLISQMNPWQMYSNLVQR